MFFFLFSNIFFNTRSVFYRALDFPTCLEKVFDFFLLKISAYIKISNGKLSHKMIKYEVYMKVILFLQFLQLSPANFLPCNKLQAANFEKFPMLKYILTRQKFIRTQNKNCVF